MATDKKLYIAIGVLVLLGAAVFLKQQEDTREEATYTLEGQQAKLPEIKISEEDTKKIDKLEIQQPPGDAGPGEKVVLVKKGDEDWEITEPIQFAANASNVKSAVDGLKSLKVKERITPGKDAYGRYDLTDDKALHVVAYKGKDKALELHVGESGSRGQMARLAGRDGVYALGGFSRYAFARELKNWRDRTIVKFEDDKVDSVEIRNENGIFVFERAASEEKEAKGDAGASKKKNWTGKHSKLANGVPIKIKNFKSDKVNDMLRAYKSLNALDFGDDKKPSDVGLDEPVATVTVMLADGAKRILEVGANAEGSNRWARKPDGEQIYSISSYVADWATAEVSKFQDEKKKDKDKEAAPPDPDEEE
jgi:hypothetical protein